MITVFDRRQIRRQRLRAASTLPDHDFLFRWTMEQIAERLSLVRRQFPFCLRIGERGPDLTGDFGIERQYVTGRDVVCEEDFFPFAPQAFDLVVSGLNLHTVNDLPGALLQIRKSLKPDGLFVAAMLGGETLHELRDCLSEAELALSRGITPRVAPFADKPQAGALLQRAGFALPVIDSEIVTVTYESIFPLMRDLRLMGEGNAIAERAKNFTGRRLFLEAGKRYAEKYAEEDGRIRASFEVIFLIGWAPHAAQQQPLPRGSAKTRLADFLGTDEIGAGEKPH